MLEQDFIEVLLRLVRIVEQDTRIPDQLLFPRHADIDRTPSQMIRGRHAPNLPIQFRRPIPTRNNDRLLLGVWSRLFGVWSRNKVFPENFYFRDLTPSLRQSTFRDLTPSIPTQHIPFVVPRPQRLQPHAHAQFTNLPLYHLVLSCADAGRREIIYEIFTNILSYIIYNINIESTVSG